MFVCLHIYILRKQYFDYNLNKVFTQYNIHKLYIGMYLVIDLTLVLRI